jgi:hypothetical protein
VLGNKITIQYIKTMRWSRSSYYPLALSQA